MLRRERHRTEDHGIAENGAEKRLQAVEQQKQVAGTIDLRNRECQEECHTAKKEGEVDRSGQRVHRNPQREQGAGSPEQEGESCKQPIWAQLGVSDERRAAAGRRRHGWPDRQAGGTHEVTHSRQGRDKPGMQRHENGHHRERRQGRKTAGVSDACPAGRRWRVGRTGRSDQLRPGRLGFPPGPTGHRRGQATTGALGPPRPRTRHVRGLGRWLAGKGAGWLQGVDLLPHQQRFRLVDGERVGEVVSLPVTAPQPAQQGGLLRVLDPLGDDAQAERRREAEDRPHDAQVATLGLKTGHEAAVDLEAVDGERLEMAERGVAGAEIVEADAKSQRGEATQHRRDVLGVAHHQAFSDLKRQAGRLQAGLVHHATYGVEQERVLELARREVDVQRQPFGCRIPALPLPQDPAGFANDPRAERDDQPGLLEHGHEVRRHDHAASGSLPAGQRLEALDPAIGEPDDRLEVELELTALQRHLQIGLQDRTRTVDASRTPIVGPVHGLTIWRNEGLGRQGGPREVALGRAHRCGTADVREHLLLEAQRLVPPPLSLFQDDTWLGRHRVGGFLLADAVKSFSVSETPWAGHHG